MCEPYLRDEGFTDVVYPAEKGSHLFTTYSHFLVTGNDAGLPHIAVAPLHTGCVELWVRPPVERFNDIRGRTVVIGRKTYTDESGISAPDLFYGFWVSLLADVGMNTGDVTFLETGNSNTVPAEFVGGKGDAIVVLAAQGPILKANAKNPGRLLLDTTLDRPWSQRVCCMLAADPGWAKGNPAALRRATRAILRTLDELSRDTTAGGRIAMEKGIYKNNPAFTEKVINEVNEHAHLDWREFDPEDTLRYYALRLAEGKLIRKTPQQVIADATDFAWFRQLQKELKP